MTNQYTRGTLVILAVLCETLNDAGVRVAADPTTLVFEIKAPDGTLTTKTFGTDTEIVKDSTGAYHLDVSATVRGIWRYRWEGTGAAEGAGEGKFYVRKSAFP